MLGVDHGGEVPGHPPSTARRTTRRRRSGAKPGKSSHVPGRNNGPCAARTAAGRGSSLRLPAALADPTLSAGMKRWIIVNGDDLGYDAAIDRGIIEAARRGVVRSATLMANLPRAAEALALARSVEHLAVGLHLNFARGPALAAAPSLRGEGGELEENRVADAREEDVLAEGRAQIARFEELAGGPPTHLDVHKHLHRHATVLAVVARLALERSIPARSIDPIMRTWLRRRGVATPDAFFGDTGPTAFWTRERLLATLAGAPEGVSELMCHPGYPPVGVRSGYGPQREVELQALTDPAVLACVAGGDVQLCNFATLART